MIDLTLSHPSHKSTLSAANNTPIFTLIIHARLPAYQTIVGQGPGIVLNHREQGLSENTRGEYSKFRSIEEAITIKARLPRELSRWIC